MFSTVTASLEALSLSYQIVRTLHTYFANLPETMSEHYENPKPEYNNGTQQNCQTTKY